MVNQLIAYHGKQEIKDKYVALAQYHRQMDQIVQGVYWEGDGTETVVSNGVTLTIPNGRGCCVGCLHHSSDHAALADEMNVPEWLIFLADTIHEGLPFEQARDWPGRFTAAIQTGSDLSLLWNHFTIYICDFVRPYIEDESILDNVQALHRRALAGDEPADSEWAAARAAAWAAAEAAARGAAREAARAVAFEQFADELIRLLEGAEIAGVVG